LWYCGGTLNYSEIDEPWVQGVNGNVPSLVGRLRPRSARGRLQANPKRLCFTRATHRIVRSLLRQRIRPSVRLSHDCVVKHILKLFRPSGSPIILGLVVFFSGPAPIPNSKGNPFSGGYIHGVGKLAIAPFISETVRDRPMVTMER